MLKLLLVALGGALGSVARYGVNVLAAHADLRLPWATFAVNVLGCLLIGAVMGYTERHPGWGALALPFLVTGFLGGFTTFSAFGHESFRLIRDGESGLALANLTGNVLLGLAGVWFGWVAARWCAGEA